VRRTPATLPGDPPITRELVREHNLTEEEYARIEAMLAPWQGERLLGLLQSDAFKTAVIALTVVAVAGTAASIVVLWRRTRGSPSNEREKSRRAGNTRRPHAV